MKFLGLFIQIIIIGGTVYGAVIKQFDSNEAEVKRVVRSPHWGYDDYGYGGYNEYGYGSYNDYGYGDYEYGGYGGYGYGHHHHHHGHHHHHW